VLFACLLPVAPLHKVPSDDFTLYSPCIMITNQKLK
jgi:hypothetical protein